MSLQVWLPFTDGTLKQQGLSSNIITCASAVYETNGKLGQCLKIDNYYSTATIIAALVNKKQMSCSFWLKLNSGSDFTVYSDIVSFGIANASGSSTVFRCEVTSSSGTSINWFGNGCITDSGGAGSLYSLNLDTWMHMAVVIDGTTIKTYQNGILKNTYTIPSSYLSYYFNGRFSFGDNGMHCSLNDVRIYDHCLSPMEVKELAKGLVLHYPLNRQGWGQENLILNTNDLTKWSKESTCTITLENDGYYHIASTNTNGSRYGIYYDLTFPEVGTYTLSADVRTDWRIGFAASSSFGWTANTVTGTGNAQHVIKTITTTSENNKCRIYINSQMNSSGVVTNSTYIKNIKVEKGSVSTPWCPNSADELADTMGLNSNIEYDTSGFNNNGTKVGILTYTSDTPKYEVSTIFPENPANYIVTTGLKQQVFTWTCWFKVLGAVEKSYQFILSEGRDMGSVGTNICTTKAGTGLYLDSHGIRSSTANISLNEWYHVALVCDDSQMSFYLNGQLIGSKAYTAETDYAQSNDAFVVGKMSHAYTNTTVYFPFNGQISDVRIYATALSASDVKSLYQNEAQVDALGNVLGPIR